MAQEKKTNVMVIGAAGNIGGPVVSQLLKHPQFNVSALTRASSKSTFPKDVTAVRIPSYTLDHLVPAFQKQDIVICAVAPAGLSEVMTIVDAVIKAGVKRFLPTELGFDTSSDACLAVCPPMQSKREVIKYLVKHEDKISWTAVCCGLWIDYCLIIEGTDTFAWKWWSPQQRKMTLFDGGNVAFEVSTLNQAAQGIVASILPENLEATKNQWVYVHSAAVTSRQVFESLKRSTQTTDKEWAVDHVDTKELGAAGRKTFQEVVTSGDPPEVFSQSAKFHVAIQQMITSAYVGDGFNQFGDRSKNWMQKLGMRDQNLDEVVKDIVDGLETGSKA